jgi:TonB family protein
MRRKIAVKKTLVSVLRLMTLAVVVAFVVWAMPQPLAEPDRQICICKFVAPTYPTLARLAHMQGIIRIKTNLDSTGSPQDIEALQDVTMQPTTKAILQRAGIDAVRKWRFCPSGDSKQSTIIITLEFKLLVDTKLRTADQWYPTDVSFQAPATVEITTTTASVRTD